MKREEEDKHPSEAKICPKHPNTISLPKGLCRFLFCVFFFLLDGFCSVELYTLLFLLSRDGYFSFGLFFLRFLEFKLLYYFFLCALQQQMFLAALVPLVKETKLISIYSGKISAIYQFINTN